MNVFKLSMAGINTAEGIKRFNGNAGMYEKYLFRFPEDKNYAAMCEALEKGDTKAAFTAAHTLKGVAGNLSLSKLYNDIIPLVEELRAGKSGSAPELLPSVEQDYQSIISALADAAE